MLGGTQSLHTNSFDEALRSDGGSGPAGAADAAGHRHEAGVVSTIDPLGGSYYVEHLTNVLEAEAYEYFDRIEQLGGVIPRSRQLFQREIAEASFRYQSEVEAGQRSSSA